MEEKVVPEKLQPTFDNVSKYFIFTIMEKIALEEDYDYANFLFNFTQEEAIEFIKSQYEEYLSENNYDLIRNNMLKRLDNLIKSINNARNNKSDLPVMEINDYKRFFENLRRCHENNIKLYFKRRPIATRFSEYEMGNLFKQIWLRCTPDDFKHPEEFLEKSAQMLEDKTFEEYDEEYKIGPVKSFNNNILCVKNDIARTWDESSREIQFTVYDKNEFGDEKCAQYKFPAIRYGIYTKNGEKICLIGSIQNKTKRTMTNIQQNKSFDEKEISFLKKIEKVKYKANKDVPKEDTEEIEPKNIIALGMFVDLLSKKGITKIQIPGMYVLDYSYHENRDKEIQNIIKRKWPLYAQKEEPDAYKRDLEEYTKLLGKQDLISKTKTENFVRHFIRLLHHYPKGRIINYPGDVSYTMEIEIPKIKNKDELNGDLFKDLYNSLNQNEYER